MILKRSRKAPSLADYFGAVSQETSAAFACPGCGAVLNDSTSETCPYCGAAFAEIFAGFSNRRWHTDDGGETWSIVTRTCPACGGIVNDPATSRCTRCGHEPLPTLAALSDPRPTVAIRVQLPAMATGQGRVVTQTSILVRYLDCRHWPVPPSVPKAMVPLLRRLPDACQHCNATHFIVVRGHEQAWQVLCCRCNADPGVRPDAD